MKPTHNDNALFSLFHSRNDSLFQRKDWILAFILGGLYFSSLPALPPFIISDFLRTGWGVCANRGPPTCSSWDTHGPGLETRGVAPTLVPVI